MSDNPKARTTVPMNRHTKGLHDGHRELLKLAKTIGDRIVVPIMMNPLDWYAYLIDGVTPVIQELNIDTQLGEITSSEAYYTTFTFREIIPEKRVEWRRKAEDVLGQFEEHIPTSRHRRWLLGLTMDLCRQIENSVGGVKYTVRGPELHNFYTKAVKPLLGSNVEVVIYPKIIKHPESKIKLQSGLSRIDPFYYKDIYRLISAINGAKDKFKPGKNEKLVIEMNNSYAHRPWKVESVSVLEGGIIPGRLEIIAFEFPGKDGGTVLLEDATYEQ